MDKRSAKPAPPVIDRRAGTDRRNVDVPLPVAKRDRRRGLEARKPEVVEIDMSQSEWASLNEAPSPPAPKKKP